MGPGLLHRPLDAMLVHGHPPACKEEAPGLGASSLHSLVVCILPYAHHLLDLLDQWLLFFLRPPAVMLLLPVAGFLLHQPALGDPARLSIEVAVLARVAHRRSPPSS